MKLIQIFLISLLSNYSYSAYPSEWLDNWVIYDITLDGYFGGSVIGFDDGREVKLVYDCTNILSTKVKKSNLYIQFPNEFPENVNSAWITYKSDFDSAVSVSTSITDKQINLKDLYLWSVLRNSKKITIDIELYANTTLAFKQKPILFDMGKFVEAVNKANDICRFNKA